jgi:hypothetical protein
MYMVVHNYIPVMQEAEVQRQQLNLVLGKKDKTLPEK